MTTMHSASAVPDLSSARILVTGGAGFIGSALVWALNNRGAERVVIADRLNERLPLIVTSLGDSM